MKIADAFEIDVPIERMYQEINDVGQIGYCIAGVKEVVVINADESKWKIEAKAGFMARTFIIAGKITERRPPEYIGFSGNGQDVEVTGHILLSKLAAARTRCEAELEATVTGPFASLVDMMAKGPQQALIRETIANLRKRLESVESGTQAFAPPNVEPLGATRGRSRLRSLFSWLRSLFRARSRIDTGDR